MKLPYAEDVNYFQTSQSSPDVWLEKTVKLIRGMGGKALMDAFGNDAQTGQAAYMIAFEIGGDKFKVVWPVLPTRRGQQRAAKIQAATMLYHDIKAKCLSAVVLGTRSAFFSYLLLPDGRVATEASFPELMQGIPNLFATAQLSPGDDDIVEGEIR